MCKYRSTSTYALSSRFPPPPLHSIPSPSFPPPCPPSLPLPQSVCSDGRLFNNLLAEWLFMDGPPHTFGPTCNLSVKVSRDRAPWVTLVTQVMPTQVMLRSPSDWVCCCVRALLLVWQTVSTFLFVLCCHLCVCVHVGCICAVCVLSFLFL